MKTIDLSAYIVAYNFIIGVLVMIASEKLGSFAGHLVWSHRVQAARLTQVGAFTFGGCVAGISALVYLLSHLFRVW